MCAIRYLYHIQVVSMWLLIEKDWIFCIQSFLFYGLSIAFTAYQIVMRFSGSWYILSPFFTLKA